MKEFKNILYSPLDFEAQKLDLYLPKNDTFPLFIYFHGGGIEGGDKECDLAFLKETLDRGIAVVSANYRMYPFSRFPDFIDDAAAAVKWVKENIKSYGNCTHIFIGGSSAGGYLTQMLCFDKKYLERCSVNQEDISGYFMDAGQPTTHFNVLRERGLDIRRVIVDEASPLYFVDGTRKYRPMKIIVSDNDMENRLEQTKLLLSTIKSFGHDMEKVDFEIIEKSNHCEYVNKLDQNGNSIFADMIYKFISKYI